MIFITLILFWFVIGYILLETLGSKNVRNRAKQLAKSLFQNGECIRIRVKGHHISKKGKKTPLEGKIYLHPETKKYLFYADLTYGLFYDEKWLFTQDQRNIYFFSSIRKPIAGPFQPDFLPDLLTLKKEGEATTAFKNEIEEGGIIQWRELENEVIPRWITHSFGHRGALNIEITFFMNEQDFFWW